MTKAQEKLLQASLQAWAVGCRHPLGSVVSFEGRQWTVIEANHSTTRRPETYRLQLVTDRPFPSTRRVDLGELE